MPDCFLSAASKPDRPTGLPREKIGLITNCSKECKSQIYTSFFPAVLKDKSGVGIIVDYSRDYTVVNGV